MGTPTQAAIEFGQHHIAELLRSLARPNEDSAQRLGLHSLPPVRVVVVVNDHPHRTIAHRIIFLQEVVVYVLSFVANARDLCSLSMVPDDIPLPLLNNLGEVRMANIPRQVSRALAAVSRDDALWKPLGHPSWADHHVLRLVGPGTDMIPPARAHTHTTQHTAQEWKTRHEAGKGADGRART